MSKAKNADKFTPLATWELLSGETLLDDPLAMVDMVMELQAAKVKLQADRNALLKALKMHQKCHKSNWDTRESCHICDVTRAAIKQAESH